MNATKSRWNRPLVWIVGGLLLAAVGCIAIPLGDPEKSKVDPKLVGVWMSKPGDDDQTMFTVTAYDARTYFVSEFDFSKDKDKPDVTAKSRMDWKMWLTDVGGQQFATLEMITPQLLLNSPDSEDSKEKYAIAKLKLDGDKINIEMMNDDFVTAADIKDSQQLQDFIAKNLDNPKLFSKGDGTANDVDMIRVKDAQIEAASAVLSAFGQGSNGK
jgi:hypothetical protein